MPKNSLTSPSLSACTKFMFNLTIARRMMINPCIAFPKTAGRYMASSSIEYPKFTFRIILKLFFRFFMCEEYFSFLNIFHIPLQCICFICLMMVDFPDSPGPSSNTLIAFAVLSWWAFISASIFRLFCFSEDSKGWKPPIGVHKFSKLCFPQPFPIFNQLECLMSIWFVWVVQSTFTLFYTRYALS